MPLCWCAVVLVCHGHGLRKQKAPSRTGRSTAPGKRTHFSGIRNRSIQNSSFNHISLNQKSPRERNPPDWRHSLRPTVGGPQTGRVGRAPSGRSWQRRNRFEMRR